jgi:hypothetical protein
MLCYVADPHTGDETVYEDLGLDAKNYPKVPTTWNALNPATGVQ